MTVIMAEAILDYMENNKLIPFELKSNRRNSIGTKDQLIIGKIFYKMPGSARPTCMYGVWLDYEKTFNSFPHSWRTNCLKNSESAVTLGSS